jgi:hypothetical protein
MAAAPTMYFRADLPAMTSASEAKFERWRRLSLRRGVVKECKTRLYGELKKSSTINTIQVGLNHCFKYWGVEKQNNRRGWVVALTLEKFERELPPSPPPVSHALPEVGSRPLPLRALARDIHSSHRANLRASMNLREEQVANIYSAERVPAARLREYKRDLPFFPCEGFNPAVAASRGINGAANPRNSDPVILAAAGRAADLGVLFVAAQEVEKDFQSDGAAASTPASGWGSTGSSGRGRGGGGLGASGWGSTGSSGRGRGGGGGLGARVGYACAGSSSRRLPSKQALPYSRSHSFRGAGTGL